MNTKNTIMALAKEYRDAIDDHGPKRQKLKAALEAALAPHVGASKEIWDAINVDLQQILDDVSCWEGDAAERMADSLEKAISNLNAAVGHEREGYETAIAASYEIEQLKAKLEALAPQQVPDGWRLVPVEPTPEMCDQGAQAIVSWDNNATWPDSWSRLAANQYRRDCFKAYHAMLAAAPQPAPQQVPEGWSVFAKHGRIYFSVGNQSFPLEYHPEDEPECSAAQAAEWYMGQLRHALSRLAAAAPQPAPQKAKWVGLTEQEAAECWSTSTVRTWQAIEAKLREKNEVKK